MISNVGVDTKGALKLSIVICKMLIKYGSEMPVMENIYCTDSFVFVNKRSISRALNGSSKTSSTSFVYKRRRS